MFTSVSTRCLFLCSASTKNRGLSRILYLICRGAAHAHHTKYDMERAYLRNAANSQELHINFRYKNAALNIDRDFNFCRNINEKVDDALTRIRNNVEKEVNKKLKKGKQKKKQAPEQEQSTSLQEKTTPELDEVSAIGDKLWLSNISTS